MAKFCNFCGAPIVGDNAFCTECGAPIEGAAVPEPAPTPTPAPAPQPQAQPQPQQRPAQPQQPQHPPIRAGVLPNNEVSTSKFFWLILLYGIPVVGWIFCTIMAFAASNPNIRHYSRAMFIWLIIGLALGLACYLVLTLLLKDFMAQLALGYAGIFG